MTNPYDNYVTNESLEVEGVWLDRPDFRIRIAHAGGGNEAFAKEFERQMKPHRKTVAAGRMNNKVAEMILLECYSKHAVKDWNVLLVQRDEDGQKILDEKGSQIPILDDENNLQWQRGIHDVDGTVMSFTPANVQKIFRAVPRLFAEVRAISDEYTNYLEEIQEQAAKN